MGTFGTIQLLRVAQNRDVYALSDDKDDKVLSVCFYEGAVSTLPTDTELFGKGCIMVHKSEQNVYINTANDLLAPVWVLVGGTTSSFPTLVPGQFLTNDGVALFWQSISAALSNILTTKGDLLAHNGLVATRFGIGADGTVLHADSTKPEGIDWRPASNISIVNIDNSTSTTSGDVQVLDIQYNITNNLTTADKPLLVIDVVTEESETISTVEVNSVGATFLSSVTKPSANLRLERWYMVNPSTAVLTIDVQMSGSAYITSGARLMSNVDQLNPFTVTAGYDGLGTDVDGSVTTTTFGSLVLDALGTADFPITHTEDIDQTLDYQDVTGTYQGSGSSKFGVNPGLVETGYTLDKSADWVLLMDGVKASVSTSDAGNNLTVDQTPLGAGSTYNLLQGVIDGVNTTFTVDAGSYISGTLVVSQNGLELQQGSTEDWVETSPLAGTFDFVTPPVPGDIILAEYQTTNGTFGAQTGLQFQDEGVNLGTPGTVNEVDFVGEGVQATRVGDKVTVTVPGGGVADGSTITGTGTTVDPFVAVGGGGDGMFEQNLGGGGSPGGSSGSTHGTFLRNTTAEVDGSVLYASFFRSITGRIVVCRYEKTSSGAYKKTHENQIAQNTLSSRGGSMCVIGSHLYVSLANTSSHLRIRRLDKADLSGSIEMTLPSTSIITPSGSFATFTDGTDILLSLSAGVWTRYTISGTTLSSAGTITGGPSNASCAYGIGPNVIISNDITTSLYSYTSTFALITSSLISVGGLGINVADAMPFGVSLIDSDFAYFSFDSISTQSTQQMSNLIIKPFTLPI